MCFSFVDYSYFRTETPHLSLSIPLLIVMQLRKCPNDFLSIPNHCDSCVMARPHNLSTFPAGCSPSREVCGVYGVRRANVLIKTQ